MTTECLTTDLVRTFVGGFILGGAIAGVLIGETLWWMHEAGFRGHRCRRCAALRRGASAPSPPSADED